MTFAVNGYRPALEFDYYPRLFHFRASSLLFVIQLRGQISKDLMKKNAVKLSEKERLRRRLLHQLGPRKM